MTDRKRHGFILLLVAGLIGASIALIATRPTRLGLDLKGGVELVYKAEPNQETPVITPDALQRAVDVMNNRVNQLGVSQPQITTDGKNLIDVQMTNLSNVAEAENDVCSTSQLFFYDWEGAVLNPANGQPAANGILTGDTASIALSQGNGTTTGPGSNSSAAGALGFHQAVAFAAKQHPSSTKNSSGFGNQFFMFGAPGSSACAASAAATSSKVQKGAYCLIAQTAGLHLTKAKALTQMKANLSSAETTGTQVLEVPDGIQVLQAAPASLAHQPKYGTPNAGYYVIRDQVALRGDDITNPQSGTDSSGQPD
ncbi:MAG: hypothetical protein ACRDLT_06195, partial [Solirubrobacteraceae bacterium]